MNKRLCTCGWMFSGFICLLMCQYSPVLAQGRDPDEIRLEIGKMGVDEQEERLTPAKDKMLIDKEIKYVAGPDGLWFTDDDAVYEHYQIEHDQSGRIFKTLRYTPGKDGIPFTYDDILKEFQMFEYGLDGKLLKEILYDGQNARKYALISTTVYTYDSKGRKIKRSCSYPGKKKVRTVVYSYDEAGNQVQGVESWGDTIEKYHRFEYDASGKLVRAMEYLEKNQGKGPDGVWFTTDDVVSSTKESFYNFDGKKAEDNKYISPGTDGKWFTDDDKMQYYVLFEYQQ
ncbi:MAG: hypothetical protein V2A70_04480 [Candidatus Omnitrophota bacterium]